MIVVCDTGPLLAVLNSEDKYHAAATAFFDDFHGDLVVPSLVVTEVCYLAQVLISPEAEARFLDSIVREELRVEHPARADWTRMTQLVRQYADFPLGVADASVIAIAERLDVTRVATTDHRHFRAVRPSHCEAFELLPG